MTFFRFGYDNVIGLVYENFVELNLHTLFYKNIYITK
jgi:hypothetical protein